MTEILYKTIKVETEFYTSTYKLPKAKTFEQLKEYTAEAFYKGVRVCRFYSDARKVNDFLEVRKEQFDPKFIEDCYKKLKLQNEINDKQKCINICKSNIEYNQKRILLLESEIKELLNSEQSVKESDTTKAK